ncbi:ABC transporter permease [Treponema primitia]|uniref:ABC transporter permease n=1 Tax=Treponema primitia TaxID=88058 RepID=UPI000255509B|nr:ABC transporter permease [Treponema primitia]
MADVLVLKRVVFPRRVRTMVVLLFCIIFLAVVFAAGLSMVPAAYDVNFQEKNLMPGLRHPFGTDWLGRDMFARTLKGLSTSIIVGVSASAVSTLMALALGVAAAMLGRRIDMAVTWFIDLFLSIPHMILLILIAIAVGKGFFGVLIGVAATHWTSLTRVIRAEVLALKSQPYIAAAKAMGKGPVWIGTKHLLPHVLPQFMVALILLFPHAILHEASITFLGFGLSPEQPAIGVILSESMQYLTAGMWHLAFFPGLCLLVVVLLFDALGENLRILFNPGTANG